MTLLAVAWKDLRLLGRDLPALLFLVLVPAVVIGVIAASGRPVAFQRSTAFAALKNGQEIAYETIRLTLDAGGIRAVDADGTDLGSHQAFWFAWSQFYPETELWSG